MHMTAYLWMALLSINRLASAQHRTKEIHIIDCKCRRLELHRIRELIIGTFNGKLGGEYIKVMQASVKCVRSIQSL